MTRFVKWQKKELLTLQFNLGHPSVHIFFARNVKCTYLHSVRTVGLVVFFGLTPNDNGGTFAIVREQLVILVVSAIAADLVNVRPYGAFWKCWELLLMRHIRR